MVTFVISCTWESTKKIYPQIKENNVRQLGNDRLINFWSDP